ncbi:MAG: N-6 DNA methylase [Promethearchaeota archaeon]
MPTQEKEYNAHAIITQFGLKSKVFKDSLKILTELATKSNKLFKKHYESWYSHFKIIYGAKITQDLFLKHTYYSIVLKILLLSKLRRYNDMKGEFTFYKRFFSDEEVLFNWVDFDQNINILNYNSHENVSFSREDLFHELYQQVFISETRHKIGEFYTSPILVKEMVNDSYALGMKVLDPSCGSGTFLIAILLKILRAPLDEDTKIEFISHIFGFDVNPLAILTAKTNILMILIDFLNIEKINNINLNVFLMDSLFPEQSSKELKFDVKQIYHSLDLIIGNPPWLTYKDLHEKSYQEKIRKLAEQILIKPPSQYTTHIEIASIFFYAIPLKYLKNNGKIFFVITKSVLNGDHCYRFRSFKVFDQIEIWDFPQSYFFNVNHICLKAKYIGKSSSIPIHSKFPILTKIFDENIKFKKEVMYNSLKLEDDGARIILPEEDILNFNELSESNYKKYFYQGATLVPKSLLFFKIDDKLEKSYLISPDLDVLSRSKAKWKHAFSQTKIEKPFRYKTFLNMDLVPFCIKSFRNIFLPINKDFQFNEEYLRKYPNSLKFYNDMNAYYIKNKKSTSDINTLFSNVNYWNKLTKQVNAKANIVIYNASGSNLKSAVITNRKKKLIIGSENYYYSTDSQYEAYFLSAILNAPILSKTIKLIKSSRHIHKRPFSYPIPIYNDDEPLHRALATKGKKYHTVVRDLVLNNPKINANKVRTFIYHKLTKLDELVNQIIFK